MFLSCYNCKIRYKCVKLCNTAELYVNQDNITRKEGLLGDRDNYLINQKWPGMLAIPQVVISMFFTNLKKQSKIAKKLKISHQYVSAILKQYRPIYAKKQAERQFLSL